jgi:flagellar motor switch protein FliM
VWRNLVEAKFAMSQTESNPQLVHIVAPTEVVVYITFEIKMGNCAGTMSMCVPFNVIETVLGKLTTQSWFGYKPKEASAAQEERLRRSLSKTTVNLVSFLGATQIKVSDLRGLQEGDIIQLDKRVKRDLLLQIAGHTKWAGKIGHYRGRKALRITRAADGDENL